MQHPFSKICYGNLQQWLLVTGKVSLQLKSYDIRGSITTTKITEVQRKNDGFPTSGFE